jgi:NADP-dependent 3-hydroxy acid dehydrogenase YdfG
MPTLAIVGAGPSLGLSIARRFGGEGFDVALMARSVRNLEGLAETLRKEGIVASGFVADVLDRPSLINAFAHVRDRFGSVDVLEYSPAPTHNPSAAFPPVSATEVTIGQIQPLLDYHLYGALTATHEVLPDMMRMKSGTLFFTSGPASRSPHPELANIGIAGGALRNWVLNLSKKLNGTGVYAAHVVLETWIGHDGPRSQPDAIADSYWQLFNRRDEPEHILSTS